MMDEKLEKLTIEKIETACDSLWDEIWAACDYSTFFHSRYWAEIWGAYTGGDSQVSPRLLTFSDGARALLPLSVTYGFKSLSKRFYSSPASTYGGWLSSDKLDERHGALLTGYMLKLGDVLWRLNPYEKIQAGLKIGAKYPDETDMIELCDGMEKITSRWTKGHWSAVTKAQREGVTVRVARSAEDWKDYYDIYEDSLRRWGETASSRYSFNLFEKIMGLPDQHVKLWLAFYDGRAVAGALCFYSRRHVAYWHGASLESHFKLRPVNFLVYEAISDACKNGFIWFDFSPSGGHEGVKSFKKSFGTCRLDTNLVFKRSLRSIAIDSALKMLSFIKRRG